MKGVYRPGQFAFPLMAALAAAAACGLLAHFGAREFAEAAKPPYSPPLEVFLFGWAAATIPAAWGLTLALRDGYRARLLCLLYYTQLVTGVLWCAVFFALCLYPVALALILLQWGIISAAVFLFSFAHPLGALCLIPAGLIASLAAYVNMGVLMLRR